MGPGTLERAYYHCQPCGKGWFPRDQALGMAGTSLSLAVTRMTGSAAAEASFATASELLHELAAVRVNAKRVERLTEAPGREVAAAEQASVFDPQPPAANTMYLGVDGTGAWQAERRIGLHARGEVGRDLDRRTVRPRRSAGLRREAERRGFSDAECRVILGDGVKWIWGAATEMFPSAIQIVDFFHVSERMWEVARVPFAADRDSADTWAEARCEDLKSGALDAALATLRAHAGHCEPAPKAVQHITSNRQRMRYAEFRAQGLQIGSGVVGAGCKTVVGRLKQSGMYWTVDGAEGLLAQRACILGGRYEDSCRRPRDGKLHACQR